MYAARNPPALECSHNLSTLSLPRVIDSKFPCSLTTKYNHTVWRTWLFIPYSDESQYYTTNSHYLTWEWKGYFVPRYCVCVCSFNRTCCARPRPTHSIRRYVFLPLDASIPHCTTHWHKKDVTSAHHLWQHPWTTADNIHERPRAPPFSRFRCVDWSYLVTNARHPWAHPRETASAAQTFPWNSSAFLVTFLRAARLISTQTPGRIHRWSGAAKRRTPRFLVRRPRAPLAGAWRQRCGEFSKPETVEENSHGRASCHGDGGDDGGTVRAMRMAVMTSMATIKTIVTTRWW